MLPLLPLTVGATVAGIGFAVGQKLADTFFIPWATEVAKNWRRRWGESADARRKRQLDEVDPVREKKGPKK